MLIGFTAALVLSTFLIKKCLPFLQSNEGYKHVVKTSETSALDFLDTGFWIGFFEMLLIFVFVMHKEFSAIAIIFAAKEFVRKEKIADNPTYYLLGTLINLGIGIVVSSVLRFYLIK